MRPSTQLLISFFHFLCDILTGLPVHRHVKKGKDEVWVKKLYAYLGLAQHHASKRPKLLYFTLTLTISFMSVLHPRREPPTMSCGREDEEIQSAAAAAKKGERGPVFIL